MKPKLGVFKFASCDGCQLSLLDCEDELLQVAEADGRPICCVIVDMAAGMGDKRVAVMGRFRHGAEEQVLTFDLDVTSGDWLITDIRPEGARPSLRRLLRLTR